MTRDDVLATLRRSEASLRAMGVSRAALFGSVARGEQGPDSDIDIMIEIDPSARLGLWEYTGVIDYIADMFPLKVDVANRAGLKAHVRPTAERDAVYAF
jgi:predicted nucleotidyltransferase